MCIVLFLIILHVYIIIFWNNLKKKSENNIKQMFSKSSLKKKIENNLDY